MKLISEWLRINKLSLNAKKTKFMIFDNSDQLVGCALFSKFLGLNVLLVELDELSSGVPSFLKSDHGKLLRIAILCLVTWVSRGTCVMVS